MTEFTTQSLALAVGLLMLTSTLMLWRRSLAVDITLLSVQGAALALLLVVIAAEGETHLYITALGVFAAKAVLIPSVLRRSRAATGADRELAPRMNATGALLLSAALTTLAYLVARPLLGSQPSPTLASAPVGLAMILIGFLVLLTRREAISQMIGFVVIDNGIAAMAVLLAGGVPLIVEAGVLIDVVLVVFIQSVLARRVQSSFGTSDLLHVRGLHD